MAEVEKLTYYKCKDCDVLLGATNDKSRGEFMEAVRKEHPNHRITEAKIREGSGFPNTSRIAALGGYFVFPQNG